MIRVLVFLVLLAAAAFGAAWLADRPGDVVLVWQGYRIETSLVIALAGVVALAFAVMALWGLVRFVLNLPGMMAFASRARRRARGHAAISRGMIAVGAGDPASARRFANDAERLLGREPLALLLKAQAAQISGDRPGAEAAFNSMLDEPETRVLGLRGLYVEARRKGDQAAARAYAAKAAQLAPGVGWANEAALEYQSADRDWRGALATLERRASLKLLDREQARRQRAVLLTADALDRADREPDAALAAAREAANLAPDLAPAVALAGRLLARQGHIRKAAKVLEAGWKAGPHPEIAHAYLDLRHGDSTHDRLERAQALVKWTPHHPEARLALAEAALAAQEPTRARAALEPLLNNSSASLRPTARACLLMADIAEAAGDMGGAREWLGRAARSPRDPAWIADGIVSDTWAPVSPVTGRLDAFRWATPPDLLAGPASEETVSLSPVRTLPASDDVLADLDEPEAGEAVTGPVIEAEAAKPAPAPSMPRDKAVPEAASERRARPIGQTETLDTAAPVKREMVGDGHDTSAPAGKPVLRPLAAPVVFPVPHAPDDPGPAGADLPEAGPAAAVRH